MVEFYSCIQVYARMFNLLYTARLLLHTSTQYFTLHLYLYLYSYRYRVLCYVVKALEVFIASREKSQHHTMTLACVNRESQQL